MMAVGVHGQGGVTRRADGRLQVSIVLPSGRRVYRMVPKMADRRKQERLAERIRRDLSDDVQNELEPSSQPLADYLRSWLHSLRTMPRRRVRSRTLEFYEMIVENHIIPTLGRYRLDRLSERHIQSWLDADRGSVRSIHHHRAVLRRALNIAVSQRVLARNPALNVELPEVNTAGGDPLSAAETVALLEATKTDRLGVLWRLAIVTGMRQGELLGLAWEDLDLEVGTVSVVHQLQRVDGEWVRSRPKASRALDRIAIDAATTVLLREHQRRAAIERQPEWLYPGLVFHTPTGRPWSRTDILRAFHAACDLAGIRRRRFHDLRHANATLLADAGIAEDVRQRRLGHSTKDMARHYARASEAQDRDAVERLVRVIGD